jgi:hypothetical protein
VQKGTTLSQNFAQSENQPRVNFPLLVPGTNFEARIAERNLTEKRIRTKQDKEIEGN